MRSRTLANERTRDFYNRLKRPYLFNWYLSRLGSKRGDWERLSGKQKRSDFKINQIAFFRKHFWYHFDKFNINGWIPVKHFRRNYCRLKLPINRCNSVVNSELACIIMMCRYIKPNVNTGQIIHQYYELKPDVFHDNLFMIITSHLGRFQNVSHKSTRRIRNQVRHQRPVIMKLSLAKNSINIIIDGFNRRVFQYISPLDGQLHLITRKRLLKAWRKCHYRAFSC